MRNTLLNAKEIRIQIQEHKRERAIKNLGNTHLKPLSSSIPLTATPFVAFPWSSFLMPFDSNGELAFSLSSFDCNNNKERVRKMHTRKTWENINIEFGCWSHNKQQDLGPNKKKWKLIKLSWHFRHCWARLHIRPLNHADRAVVCTQSIDIASAIFGYLIQHETGLFHTLQFLCMYLVYCDVCFDQQNVNCEGSREKINIKLNIIPVDIYTNWVHFVFFFFFALMVTCLIVDCGANKPCQAWISNGDNIIIRRDSEKRTVIAQWCGNNTYDFIVILEFERTQTWLQCR